MQNKSLKNQNRNAQQGSEQQQQQQKNNWNPAISLNVNLFYSVKL